jgi:hypothetical protein
MRMIDRTLRFGWVLGAGFALISGHAAADQMTRPAVGVTRIAFNTPGELSVRPGAEEKLVVEAEAKVLAQLEISVKGDTLTIASKGNFKTDKGIKYTLTIKSFRGLKNGASGNSAIDGFSGTDADIELDGSGDAGLKNMKYGRLGVVIKGSGNAEASGGGKTVVARIDGSGNIDTTGYPAQVVEAVLEGSGNIRVAADESLKATISGAGNIEYKGKAKVTQSITGAGNVGRI